MSFQANKPEFETVENHHLDQASAKRLINSLKKGTTPLDLAIYLNVGNERWYEAAEEFCADIEADGDSMVRFVNGYYGDGKTHFLGILRTLAIRRCWMVSYVTLENTPIHKFDRLYAEVVKNFQIPGTIALVPWLPDGGKRGAIALLSAFFSKCYVELNGSVNQDGLNKMAVLRGVKERTHKILAQIGVHELVANAVRSFINSALALKRDELQAIAGWAEGQPVLFKEFGLTKRINGNLAHDFLRSLASIAKQSGIKGSLLLLDEAERVMDQSRLVRRKSYGVIRDLLDNADGQGGMPSSMIYLAATPEMFSSETGFAEYDALRSRLASTQHFDIPDLIDWRAVIVDLVKTPLPHDHLVQLAHKVRDVHAVARHWDASAHLTDDIIGRLVDKIESGVSSQVSRPRMLSSVAATLLEIAEQNPDQPLSNVVDSTFDKVLQVLAIRPQTEKWQ